MPFDHELYESFRALEKRYFVARGWIRKEGWCATEDCINWHDPVSGEIMHCEENSTHVYSPSVIMHMMEQHKISVVCVPDLESGSTRYIATVWSGLNGEGISHRHAVMELLIKIYENESCQKKK